MLCIAAWLCLPIADTTASAEDGFHSIFDGKTFDGWDGNPKFWRVEDGTITGQTTEENPTSGNTFIIWRNGETTDFELKLEYKIVGGNSGIQYRSFEVPDKKWVVGGYQADFEAGTTYSGILYGERFRGILAPRGKKTVIGADHKPKVISEFADGKMLQDKIKKEDWNEYHIIARGFSFTHKINGTVMSECRDDDKEMRRANGILALQLHAGPPMKVQFRNIRIKHTSPAATTAAVIGQPRFDVASTSDQGESQVDVTVDQGDVKVNTGNAGVTVDAGKDGVKVETGNAGVKVEVGSGGVKVRVGNGKLDIRIGGDAIGALFNRIAGKKKIAFVAGHKSHGYGAHEHKAGCLLLAAAINQNVPNTEAIVYVDGWPEEPGLLDDADAIVVYADGGGKHPFNSRLEEVDRLMQRGSGLV